MSFIAAVRTLRVALEYNLEGHLVVNVYHVQKSTAIVSADLTAVAQIFWTWWNEDIRGYFSTAMSLQQISLRDLTSVSGDVLEYTTDLPLAGSNGALPLGNNQALVASWRTGFAGRSFRGRTYFAGLAQSLQDTTNTVLPDQAGFFAEDVFHVTTLLQAEDYNLVVASFQHDNAPRASAVLTQPNAVVVNTLIDTQRRRMRNAT